MIEEAILHSIAQSILQESRIWLWLRLVFALAGFHFPLVAEEITYSIGQPNERHQAGTTCHHEANLANIEVQVIQSNPSKQSTAAL